MEAAIASTVSRPQNNLVNAAGSGPPVDFRPCTTLADLPSEVRSWLCAVFGRSQLNITPVNQLVNSNHCFYIDRGAAKFFLKVIQRGDAAASLAREVSALRRLAGLPVPEMIEHNVITSNLAVLLTNRIDALPLRHLDFHGSLAPLYLEQLGAILSFMHERLRGISIAPRVCQSEFEPKWDDLEPAAYHYLGSTAARDFLRKREEALTWLRHKPSAIIHGDLQDKNILLSQSGQIFVCDFEFVRQGSLVYELSVENIFLKRQLNIEEQSKLQQLLLAGYRAEATLFGTEASVHINVIRRAKLMHWQFTADCAQAVA